MIISATAVLHPRKQHRCAMCEKIIAGAHVRLYGAADESDPPFVLRLHEKCCLPTDPKIVVALEKLKAAA